MPVIAVYAIIAAVLVGAGFAGGYSLSSKIADGEIARCELRGKEMVAAHQTETQQRMQTAKESTDKAMVYAMQRITEAEQQSEELRNEIKSYTTSRDCLSGNARSVLEQSAAFRKVEQQRVPKNTGGANPAAAGAAANTGDGDESRNTTDADIADWIAIVGGLYEQCRSRVEAIGKWNDGLDVMPTDGRN